MRRNGMTVLAILFVCFVFGSACSKEKGKELLLLSFYQNDYTQKSNPVIEAMAKVEKVSVTATEGGAKTMPMKVGDREVTVINYDKYDSIAARLNHPEEKPVAALLVVSAVDGYSGKKHGELIQTAKEKGIPVIAILMSNIELVDDKELLDLEETEIHDALDTLGFPGIKLIRCSTQGVTEGNAEAVKQMEEFLSAVRGAAAPLLSANK